MDAFTDTEQLYARVAWLYHKEDLTQGEIADLLGLTRLRVNKMLGECRSRGIVQVTLNTRFESCVMLERQLIREFGLTDAVVIPTPRDPERIPRLVGQAAGQFLVHFLRRHGISAIGVGWGATLREGIRAIEGSDLEGASVVSLMGGLTRGFELNTFEIATELARKLHASCSYLAAPIYAGSRESRDTIVAQTVFAEVMERMRSVEIAILGSGDLSSRSLLIRHGRPEDVTVESLVAAGAVGDLLGQFIDRTGVPVDHELNQRVVALPLATLREIPTVVLASGGVNKAEVIGAALRGGLVRVVVSDEATVRSVLGEGDAIVSDAT